MPLLASEPVIGEFSDLATGEFETWGRGDGDLKSQCRYCAGSRELSTPPVDYHYGNTGIYLFIYLFSFFLFVTVYGTEREAKIIKIIKIIKNKGHEVSFVVYCTVLYCTLREYNK